MIYGLVFLVTIHDVKMGNVIRRNPVAEIVTLYANNAVGRAVVHDFIWNEQYMSSIGKRLGKVKQLLNTHSSFGALAA